MSSPFQITVRCPTRIDLAGGTLDIAPMTQVLQNPTTVNCGIDLFATCKIVFEPGESGYEFRSDDQGKASQGTFFEVIRRGEIPLIETIVGYLWDPADGGFKLSTSAMSPAGAGLGGSSALAVAVCSAIFELKSRIHHAPPPNEYDIIRTAQDIETKLIHAPTGCQDYWGAMRGALNILTFPPGGTQISTLRDLDLSSLNRDLVVCYSGKSRASAINNWEIFKEVFDGNEAMLKTLNQIAEAAEKTANHLAAGDFTAGLEASGKEWALRCELWPNIHSDETKHLESIAMENGAYLSRVCGAGGGGVMVMFCEEEKKSVLTKALTESGGHILGSQISSEGRQISVEELV